MRKIFTTLAVLALVLMTGLLNGTTNTHTAYAQTPSGSQYFSETHHTVKGWFLKYWQEHGGLAQQGYPMSEEMTEISETDGKTYTMQYFERAVFELHPENQYPNNVLLSLLGAQKYQLKYGTPGAYLCGCDQKQALNNLGFRSLGALLDTFQVHGDYFLEVESCTIIQLNWIEKGGHFTVTNPYNYMLDGWMHNASDRKAYGRPDGSGIPKGTWEVEGISFLKDQLDAARKQGASSAQPTPPAQQASSLEDQLAQRNGYANAAAVAQYFQLKNYAWNTSSGDLQVVPASGQKYFDVTNPDDFIYNGWRYMTQPDGSTLDKDHQQGIPKGHWWAEGMTIFPKR